jgi:hypothetical protein
MSDQEEADVARADKAVRKAYDELQELRASCDSKIPSSLSNAGVALDQLLSNLNLLTESAEAASIFREFALKEASSSDGTTLSDAIVHDMEAITTHFSLMKPMGTSEKPNDLNKQECRDIEEMVDRYNKIISSVLTKHHVCV